MNYWERLTKGSRQERILCAYYEQKKKFNKVEQFKSMKMSPFSFDLPEF